jgi:hypothetical protein
MDERAGGKVANWRLETRGLRLVEEGGFGFWVLGAGEELLVFTPTPGTQHPAPL